MKGWLAGCRQKGRLMAGWLDGWKDGRVMHGGQIDGSRVSQEHTDCSRVYWGDISSMSHLTDTWHGLLNLRRLTPLPHRGLAGCP